MHPVRQANRIAELRAIIDAYHHLSIEEAETSDFGDRETEAVAELWRLEQIELEKPPAPRRRPKRRAA